MDVEECYDVHGGLTYSNKCCEKSGICHVPAPGMPDDVWWFGFDCAHGGDLVPGMSHSPHEFMMGQTLVSYKNLEYVTREIKSLAEQLAATLPTNGLPE
jgi:hypothetical protein